MTTTDIATEALTGTVETVEERPATYESNLSNDAASFGFEYIGEVDWEDESYSFDLMLVLRDFRTGAFYTAADSGCSCSSPFEDHSRKDAEGPFTAFDVIEYIQGRLNEAQRYAVEYGYGRDVSEHIRASAMDMIERLVRIR